MIISAVIVAGGLGRRMNSNVPKQFLKLGSKPIIVHTIKRIASIPEINEIVLVLPEEDIDLRVKEIRKNLNYIPLLNIVTGGKERQDSVFNGLKSCNPSSSIVIIHDAVRPFFSKQVIAAGIKEITDNNYDGVICAVPVTDTIKLSENNGIIEKTVDRKNLYRAQTPQIFKKPSLDKAFKNAYLEKKYYTDDSAMVEAIGGKIKIIPGSETNIKITSKKDLKTAEYFLKENLFI